MDDEERKKQKEKQESQNSENKQASPSAKTKSAKVSGICYNDRGGSQWARNPTKHPNIKINRKNNEHILMRVLPKKKKKTQHTSTEENFIQ